MPGGTRTRWENAPFRGARNITGRLHGCRPCLQKAQSAWARGIGTGRRRRRTGGGILPRTPCYAFREIQARQPPWRVISVASVTARGSQTNPFTTPPVVQLHAPDREGRGHLRDEGAEPELPHLDLDRRARTSGMDEPRLRR